MRYAMVLKNRVIDIKTSDIVPCYPPDEQGNPVTAIECDDNVILGMIYNEETGEFTEYIPPAPVPTQLDRIEEQINSIANGTTAENTEAIDALLGV